MGASPITDDQNREMFDLMNHAVDEAFAAVMRVARLSSTDTRAAILHRVAYRMLDAAACAYAGNGVTDPRHLHDLIEQGIDHPEVLKCWHAMVASFGMAPDRDAMDRVLAERLSAIALMPAEA